MTYRVIHNCPVCDHSLHVKKLACSNCHTVIENNFSLSKFSSLSKEQMHFIEIFVVKRGNIKEVEKALGVSYPTVRGKLNTIIEQLGHDEGEKMQADVAENKRRKAQIINMLDEEKITAQEAVELLKNNGEE